LFTLALTRIDKGERADSSHRPQRLLDRKTRQEREARIDRAGCNEFVTGSVETKHHLKVSCMHGFRLGGKAFAWGFCSHPAHPAGHTFTSAFTTQ